MTKTTLAALAVAAAPALACIGTSAAAAQAPDQGRLFVTAGFQTVEVAELNRRLRARGLPTFSDEHVTLGLGLDRRAGRWIVGAEGALLLAEEKSARGFQRSLGARFGLLQAGFLVPLGSGLRVYPLAGLGLSAVELSTTGEEEVGFDELLDGPGPGSELGTGGIVLQGGFGVDLSAGRLTVGLRGGYSFTPGRAEWSWRDQTVEDGPDLGLDGPFVRAVLGLVD